MLKGSGLPKNLWAEAIIAGCYIQNRFTSSSKSTSHELWFGTKPDVSGLRLHCICACSQIKEKSSALGFGNFRNKLEPLYINDDEKKDAQAPVEDVKEPSSEKPAFKIAKQVRPLLKRSLRLKAKEDAKKEEEENKHSKEDDSILSDIETYSDSESPEESGEASQRILSSIGGLFSRFSGAAANITESA
jgi:hypothetical protein